ncbi:2-amino-4-hydroxy-6-hydroxymethyldihydropteridine diphosphokinase [Desulfothermus okinawensis JCM 13304]
MELAYISLGSNMGDPTKNLHIARDHLDNSPNIKITKISSIYLTEPQGLKNQPWFANQVIEVQVNGFTPITLLHKLLKVEDLMGRKRTVRWGPRIIDLDLILFENHIIDSEKLTLPHPRMFKRAFVLIPLLEIEPEITTPNGDKIKPFLDQLNYRLKGNKIWQYE